MRSWFLFLVLSSILAPLKLSAQEGLFDHDKTRFKLTGKHLEIGDQCDKCHKPGSDVLPVKPPQKARVFVFEGANRGFCENCHVNEHKDMFHSKFSAKPCGSCHNTETFQKLKSFDHDETSFELKGKHRQVKCAECHEDTDDKYKTPPRNFKGDYRFPEIKTKNCAACHDDVHKGANGSNCMKCHNENGWKAASEFHKNFLLQGVHLQLECKSCHVGNRILHGSSSDCSTCHVKEDPHHGQLPRCQECHLQNFWNHTRFDHNMSQFPLRGAHRVTECRACHNQGVYKGLPTQCQDCHFRDAATVASPNHGSARFSNCEVCHNVYSFQKATISP